MRLSNELQIGKAGEYLVCADAIMKGLIAFPSEQGLPYDVLIDNGKRLLRVQVKTTTAPRIVPQREIESRAYIFNIKRHGKNNQARYDDGEVDLFALVCLDTRLVGYLLNGDMPATVNFRVDSLRGTHYDEKGIQDCERVLALRESISDRSEIARQTGVSYHMVNTILSPKYKPYCSSARYFSDIVRDANWFTNI